MNKFLLFFLVVYLGVFISPSSAVDYSDDKQKEEQGKPYGRGPHAPVEIPPGMEMINMGGIRMIVPQGTKIGKNGSLVTMESSEEFSVRNFKEMKDRLEKIETSQKDLKKTVDDLKQAVLDARKKPDAVQDTVVHP
jgi:hypothetical protein